MKVLVFPAPGMLPESKCGALGSRTPTGNERWEQKPSLQGSRRARLSAAIAAVSRRVLFPALSFTFLASLSASLAAEIPPMAEPDLPKFRRTSSGLKIQDVLEGSGREARPGQVVVFNYVCRRTNGYYVYSTMDLFDRDNGPVMLPLGEGQMISGLEEVIVGMKPGGKRRALVPPELGYIRPDLEPQPREFGPQRSLMAHSKEPLFFEVQLVKIK